MKYYCQDKESVLGALNSSDSGLKAEEASRRLEQNGKNKLVEGKKKSIVRRFLEQLADPMIIILIVAPLGILVPSPHRIPSTSFL